ncbi:glycoside hydrolase family 95 protein [Pseudoduganella namucuonensis]|uniref:Alpha-L-fucosidase 2 n=1 Tax=Pseudoduganella namucuonensis TaxID=1035707 RepID=A0A1I7L7V3_9BURK|nr:glycoside hydrolase family 95 protein [Pseudoduganella namucuonensis]SFV05715.1 alpha-L-fucosidase 2 [Pseudoduganella namucuonensis]
MGKFNLFSSARRTLLLGLAGLYAAPSLAFGKAAGPSKGVNTLWYRQPAARWEEALPLGNGRLGAMVFGRVAQERIQLNEDTLWAGAPYTPDNPDALATLPRVRELIAEGRYKEATDLASAGMMAKPLAQMAYGSLGDILLTFDAGREPARYERRLDLDTATAHTSYTTPAGSFVRESFASAPDQVIVFHLDALKGRLGFELAYRGPREVPFTPPDYQGAATSLVEAEATDWLMTEAAAAPRAGVTVADDGEATLLITGRNEAGPLVAAGLGYALRVKVLTDGQVDVAGGALKVRNARTATLLIAAATSYVNYHDVGGDPVASVRRQSEQAARKSYAALKRDHIRDHQALFSTVSLDLGGATGSAGAARPTDVRIAAAEASGDPALAALYFQYARYLLLASSRPGTQPANLQGIWNEGTNPPWGSKYTININTQMNYWFADAAGLGACVEPLLRMVEELSATGARTAKTMYNARGWVAHHNTDLWRAAAPIDGPMWGLWPCGGAWLCNTLWDHYDYSRDQAVLRRLYPLLKGASEFFLDTLVEDPKGRGLLTSPSLSPENQHPFGSSLCAGPAMDRQIVRDLFAHTIEAGTLLKLDDALLRQIGQSRSRLAADRVGGQGQLQEWLEDWDARAPEQRHRHVSHLYAVYPSGQVNVRDTPDLARAAKASLVQRGDLATGWGTAWRLCLWARMGEGERAHAVLKALTGPQRTYPNMFDAHPPFQIDGNFGGAAGILEMLVQSWGGEVILLPALPSAWPSGQVKGLKARGGLQVDLSWRAGKLATLLLKGAPGAQVRLRHRGKTEDVVLDARGVYRLGAAA